MGLHSNRTKRLGTTKKSSGTEATHKMMARGRISANYKKLDVQKLGLKQA